MADKKTAIEQLADRHDFIRWRVDFPDGVVARVSFRTEQLVSAPDALWETIRVHSLLQGGSGNYRVEPGGVVRSDPPEWPAEELER